MSLELIDKQDNFEIVRDQIAAVLKLEIANQQSLATAAGKDPDLWKLRIFTERSNPWEQYLNDPADTSPIVNIWYDNSNFEGAASNIAERQKVEATYNIDCYGYSKSKNNPAGGHTPGDENAAFEMQRALRLARNILMAAENTYLQLQGLIWKRWVRSVSTFQPQIDNRAIQNVIGARLAFTVGFNEFSPQVDDSNTLEYLSVLITRLDSGEIVINSNDGDLFTSGDGASTTGRYDLNEGAEIGADFDFSNP